MNIYALPGHRVRCATLNGGYEFHEQIAREYLDEGGEYTVDHTEVDSWHTDVFLVEFPEVRFNSVFFEDVKPQSKEKDAQHPDYRKYN
jgi:hypothetical protein